MKKIEEGVFDKLKGMITPKSITNPPVQPNINKDLQIAAGKEEMVLQRVEARKKAEEARKKAEKEKEKEEHKKWSREQEIQLAGAYAKDIAELTREGDIEQASEIYHSLRQGLRDIFVKSDMYSQMLRNFYKVRYGQQELARRIGSRRASLKESQNKKEPNKMTLTKNVLTRIIKEELAKIVNEQRSPRNPRRINESPEMVNMLMDDTFVTMLSDSLRKTENMINFMATLAATAGATGGVAGLIDWIKKNLKNNDGQQPSKEEAMQEAKKKAASTGSAAKMGFGTKSKMASHKFSPLKTKK